MSEEEMTTDMGGADNSDVSYSDAEISDALGFETEEPETTQADETTSDNDDKADVTSESNTDNTDVQYPDKFKKEDGSVDVESMFKSYSDLEHYKSQLLQERADLMKYKEQVEQMQKEKEQEAKNAGFNSVEDMQYTYGMAQLEANEYAKYLAYTDDPEAVRRMLLDYSDNPNPKLLNDIEMEFSPEINKRVERAKAQAEFQYQQQQNQIAQTGKLANIESVISQTVDANSEVFDYAPFKKMFVGLLQKYGDAIQPEDAILLANTMSEMKDLYRQEFEKATGAKVENKNATDKLAALGDTKSAPAASQSLDWENLTERELGKEIAKYI